MPGFDGTGPKGLGPMTGRGQGYCIVSIEDESSLQRDIPPTQAPSGNFVSLPKKAIKGKKQLGLGFRNPFYRPLKPCRIRRTDHDYSGELQW